MEAQRIRGMATHCQVTARSIRVFWLCVETKAKKAAVNCYRLG